MFQRRTLIITLSVLGGATLLAGGIRWRSFVVAKQEKAQITATQRLLQEGRSADALSIIWSHGGMPPAGEREGQWLEFEVTALEQMKDARYLLPLYDKHPALFDKHEYASAIVARALLQSHDKEGYAKLLGHWEKIKKHPEYWFEIEADNRIANGDRAGATSLLKTARFEGDKDCGRLLRLATIAANSDLKAAWQYLQEAFQKNPKHPDVRSFRGQVLERLGKPEWARVEYTAALVTNPNNPLLRDQLAQFYLRRQNYELALQTWQDGMKSPSLDAIWLKSLFWSKLYRPIDTANIGKCPSGDLEPLVTSLQHIPKENLWDDSAFESLTEARRYEKQRPEVYWLKLLNSLQRGDDAAALALLQKNSFRATSYQPYLERALVQVLTYRKSKTLPAKIEGFTPLSYSEAEQHQFILEIERSAGKSVSPQLDKFLRSDHVFSALCFAVGWCEAGLTLLGDTNRVLPADTPAWYAYAVTQSLRSNRSTEAAVAFAKQQAPSSPLRLLIAEMSLKSGQNATALEEFKQLAHENSDTGYRAAWLWATIALENSRPSEAQKALQAQPRLASAETGRELAARIALAQGKTADATRIYQQIASTSMEGKAYLAKTAFANHDWKRAENLTLELLQRYPDEMQIRANLEAIRKAQRQ